MYRSALLFLFLFLTLTLTLTLALAAGCAADTDTTETDSDTDTDADTDADAVEVASLSGSIVWGVDFDAAAEAQGLTDCSYGRSYSGGVEDRSAPWLCPECELTFRVDVTMQEGWEDCYRLISSGEPSASEHQGLGAGRFWRTYHDHYLLSDQGEATEVASGWTTLNQTEVHELEGGGGFSFTTRGELELGEFMGDPMHGFAPPHTYACGWPKADPEPWTGPWTMELGGDLPDGFFMDRCEEPVRLHDFLGHYLIIDVSAVDCGPCRAMAAEEPAFLESMADLEEGVEVITLLAPTLSAVLDPTPVATLQEWTDEYDLHSPVLADRGYGYWTAGALVGEDFGYPTWVVVAPDLEILHAGVGFSSGSWQDIEEMIRSHAGR